MKKFKRVSLVVLVAIFVISITRLLIAHAAGPAPVDLSSAGNFVILSQTGITNTGSHASEIIGNIGASPITAAAMNDVFCSEITGTIYGVDAAYVGSGDQSCFAGNPPLSNKTLVDDAVIDMGAAYVDAAGRAALAGDTNLFAGNLGGQTFVPGLYKWTTDVIIPTNVTLAGGPNDVWIFQIDGNLSIASGGSVPAGIKVLLTGGAKASNVFWQVGGGVGATLGTYSTFNGNILSATQVVMQTGAVLNGRALAQTLVTLDANKISASTATLHIVKQVINDNGGVATSSDFSLYVKSAGIDVSGSPASGTTTPGTTYLLEAGTYVVSEDANASYSRSFSGDCDVNGSVVLATGDDKTCTITNDDIAPATINVIKTVINDNGRTKTVTDFPLFVNGVSVVSGVTNTFPAAAYTITETIDPDYTQTFSGDCDATGHLNLNPGDGKVCIITNDDDIIPSSGGYVYTAPVPPLIEVVKVPNPLSLPTGPGLVTYTYTLRNIGSVTVSDIKLVGDTCSPIVLVSGDSNENANLDINETWVHSCATTLTETHTNTVVATGWANGLMATDIASAHVVVGVPVVAPLIHITKVPSAFTLPFEGGVITFTKNVTNPGIVALNNIRVTDDKCSTVKYISGDVNGDSKLDTTETWKYTCQMNIAKTTTNTASVSGDANGLTARDFALATVVVAAAVPKDNALDTGVPKLPNTGVHYEEKNILLDVVKTSSIIMLFSVMFIAVSKKRKA